MIEHLHEKDTLVVKLSGELDHHTSEQVRTRLDYLIESEKIRHMVLDLGALTFMDSSGIGVIIGRCKTLSRMHGKSGRLSVRNVGAQIDRIFHLAGLYQIVEKIA